MDNSANEQRGYNGKAENEEEEKSSSPFKSSLNSGASLFGAPSGASKAKSKKKWM